MKNLVKAAMLSVLLGVTSAALATDRERTHAPSKFRLELDGKKGSGFVKSAEPSKSRQPQSKAAVKDGAPVRKQPQVRPGKLTPDASGTVK